jgi:hypothetical protein
VIGDVDDELSQLSVNWLIFLNLLGIENLNFDSQNISYFNKERNT